MVFDQFFIINWNNEFPLDKWYREKYLIPFNSKKHRKTSYIDIFLEYYEDQLFKQGALKTIEEDRRREEYRKTKQWFVPVISEEEKLKIKRKEQELQDMFDNIDITAFNSV